MVKEEIFGKGCLGSFLLAIRDCSGLSPHNDGRPKSFIDLMPVAGREIHRRVDPWAFLPVFP